MNYTEEELCTLVDQLPDIQYNLQMPVTSINLLGLTPDLFDEEVYEILKDYFTEQKYNVLTTFLYHDTSLDMAGYAVVNIVVSVKGLKIAELLKEKYSNINRIESLFCFLYTDDNSVNASYSIQPKWGDATNDDKVDLYDAIEIAKYIMDISEFDEDTKLLADINRDGVTDLYDAIEIARIIMEESKAE